MRIFVSTSFKVLSSRGERVLAGLRQAMSVDRLHHAYLFTGAAGVGKADTARAFCAELFAQGPSLMPLRPEEVLERIARTSHPDLIWIMPDGDSIKVEQVRDLHKSLSYAPLEANKRVVVIENAHSLNAIAANAILKILEEPPAHTMFILISPDAALLLPTIRSRCQVIRFPALSDADLAKQLSVKHPQLAGAERDKFVRAAEGSLARAEALLANPALQDQQAKAQDALLTLWEACPRIPASALQFVENLEDDDELTLTLDTWYSLCRDLAVVYLQGGEKVYNQECEARIRSLAKNIRGWVEAAALQIDPRDAAKEILEKSHAVDRFRVQLLANANLRLALDVLLSNLQLFSIGKLRQGL
jgi:DNA polymerase III subunit delta'